MRSTPELPELPPSWIRTNDLISPREVTDLYSADPVQVRGKQRMRTFHSKK